MESGTSLSLDTLKSRMWSHSVGVINDILKFTQEAHLESTQVTDMIAWHVTSFLKAKADILSDYEECSDGGEAYLYPKRKLYRENIYKVIQFVFAKEQEQNLWKNFSEALIHAKERLVAVLLATELEMQWENEWKTEWALPLPSTIH